MYVRTYVLPYSLKILRMKFFMNFVFFGVPTKILALKILSYSIIQCNTSVIHENFIHETAKFTIPRKFNPQNFLAIQYLWFK